MDELNSITGKILKAAFEVHTALGPGLLESAYKECLLFQLIELGLNVVSEKPLPLEFKGVKMNVGYRLDLQVEESIIIDVKSVE